MARLLLDNVGLSLAIASLWFFGMPFVVRWSRGQGVVVRIRKNLIIGALVLFAIAMLVSFSFRPSDLGAQVGWHSLSLVVCFVAVSAITSAPRIFDRELVAVLQPAMLILLAALFGAFISHGIHAAMLILRASEGAW